LTVLGSKCQRKRDACSPSVQARSFQGPPVRSFETKSHPRLGVGVLLWVSGVGFLIWGSGCGVLGVGCRVQVVGFRPTRLNWRRKHTPLQGSGFRVLGPGLGVRVSGLGLRFSVRPVEV